MSPFASLCTCLDNSLLLQLNMHLMYDVQMLLALSVAHLLAIRVGGRSLLHEMLWQCSIPALTCAAGQNVKSHPCYLGHDVSVALHVVSVVRLLFHCLAHLPAAVAHKAALHCITTVLHMTTGSVSNVLFLYCLSQLSHK